MMDHARTNPVNLLDLPVEIQEMIYDYYFRSSSDAYAGQKVVHLTLGGTKESQHATVQYPDALLQTCRTVRNIAAPLLSSGLTLDVKSWRAYNLNQIAETLPAPFLPRFSELTMRVESETPHSVDLIKFDNLESATFDLRRVLDSRIYMSLHQPALEDVSSARAELAETLRDWQTWYPQYVEGNMKSTLFEWLHHVGNSASSQGLKEVRVSSSYFFDIEIRDCELSNSEPFDHIRVRFEVTRKLRMEEERRFWDTELIYIIQPQVSSSEDRADHAIAKSVEAQNVVQALTQEIAHHYPTIEVKGPATQS